MHRNAILALEDGRVFRGRSVGASGEAAGEVVFNTSMTGYGEILSDPSYGGQIVALTTAHVGNYGIDPEDLEADRPRAEGLILNAFTDRPSNWRSESSLSEFLRSHGVFAVADIDVRALTRHIRRAGALRGVVSDREENVDALVARARQIPPMEGRDLASSAGTPAPYRWTEPSPDGFGLPSSARSGPARQVIVLDFGIKRNTLRRLADHGCEITVMPGGTSADEIRAAAPHGVLISNGPGDPAALHQAVDTVGQLVGEVPLFGICLGHQVLGRALGGETLKLPFGHHGGNHPVVDTRTGKVRITAQNHGFAIDPDSLPPEVEVTELSGNDQTCEALRHRSLPAFSVQYHPEAGPGPHDGDVHFESFVRLMRRSPTHA